VPHELLDWPEYASHDPLDVQQPMGHDAASQTHVPAAPQAWPDGQPEHARPPVPHDVLDWEE